MTSQHFNKTGFTDEEILNLSSSSDFNLWKQKLKKEVAGDFRLCNVLKDQFRERRRTKV